MRSVPLLAEVGIFTGICCTMRSPRYGASTVSIVISSPGRASVTSVRALSSRAQRRSRTRSKSSFTPAIAAALKGLS